MFPLIKKMRGTTLFVAFILNSIVSSLISTFIVEIRLSQSDNKIHKSSDSFKILKTFLIGLIATVLVYNSMYLLVGFGSSMSATNQLVPYW